VLNKKLVVGEETEAPKNCAGVVKEKRQLEGEKM